MMQQYFFRHVITYAPLILGRFASYEKNIKNQADYLYKNNNILLYFTYNDHYELIEKFVKWHSNICNNERNYIQNMQQILDLCPNYLSQQHVLSCRRKIWFDIYSCNESLVLNNNVSISSVDDKGYKYLGMFFYPTKNISDIITRNLNKIVGSITTFYALLDNNKNTPQ